MRKVVLATAAITALSFIGTTSFAQKCASDEHHSHWAHEHPAEAAAYQEWLTNFNSSIDQSSKSKRDGDVQIIPVVFHVIHDGCVGKIDMAQVQDGLDVMNQDFRRGNLDATDTRSFFTDVAADSEIEFRLARKDPNGNSTTGVVYVDSPQTYDAQNNVKNLSYWPSEKYMNIWVVESIASFGGGGGVTLGYAQFPGSGSWNTYGTVIINRALGRIGTATADGRTLTHELGHCFGLFHTFQSGCGGNCSNSGDFVCDTPPTVTSTFGCNTTQNTCTNDQTGDSPFTSNVPDQIENYMSYDDCQNMFTQGQKDRMKGTIDAFPQLQNLISEANLEETGVFDLAYAEFETSGAPVYRLGDTVRVQDRSVYGATGWAYEFTHAVPETATDRNPEVVFITPGLKAATLTASNSNDSKTRVKDDFVLIGTQYGRPLPLTEDFESGVMPNDQWYNYNPNKDVYMWDLTDVAASSGDFSMRMYNHGNCSDAGAADEFLPVPLDFSPYTAVQVKFRMAYSRRTTADSDVMRVLLSINGGETWVPQWAQSGEAMATTTQLHNLPFTPEENEWEERTFTISSAFFMEEGVLMKWAFEGGDGNHLYLDDIELTGTYKATPVLESPRDGALDQDANTVLDWKAVGNVSEYEYQLDEINTFSTPNLVEGTTTYIDESPLNTDTEFQTSNLEIGKRYYWRVRAVTNGTPSDWSDTWTFTVSANGVGLEDATAAVDAFDVFPNPVADQSTVRFNLTESGAVNLQVIDLLGQQVMLLENRQLTSGPYQYEVNGSELGAGIYLMHLSVNGKTETKKFVVN